MEDLLLHTSGLSHRTSELYRTLGVRSRADTLPAFIRKITAAPLMEDPHTRFRYSEATTVLGRLVEVWSGEPFDYEGTHFNCRGSIGRPHPVQQPIPIWIGGNAKLTLRRVAERAQGWMPLTGPAGMFSTVRSPEITSVEDIAARLRAEVPQIQALYVSEIGAVVGAHVGPGVIGVVISRKQP